MKNKQLPMVRMPEHVFNRFLAELWALNIPLPEIKRRQKKKSFYESDRGIVPKEFRVILDIEPQ